jgi:hypothetical protein
MPTVDKYQVHELYADLRVRLARDPLFISAAELETLDRRVAQLPDTIEQLFGDTLQGGSVAYRYAGVLLATELVRRFGPNQRFTYDGALAAEEGEILFYGGDLRVAGDLVLGEQAMLVVVGDLDVEGSFIGSAAGYSLLGVGGAMAAHGVMTAGELIVAQRLAVRDVVYLYGQGTALAPAVRARVLVENDRRDTLGRVSAEEHIIGALARADPERLQYRVAAVLGLEGVVDVPTLEAALRARLTTDVPC